MSRRICLLVFLLISSAGLAYGAESIAVPILLYHRFGPVVADSMTVRTAVFEADLHDLHRHGYTVIPLQRLVAFLAGSAPPPPQHSVVITADDGHQSVFTEMFPVIRREHIPVTLFIYPSAISNASYAMTWQQLRVMQDSGLVEIQSHTYWHPNLKKEKRRLDKPAYRQFVDMQLLKSKQLLEQKLGKPVTMLAWAFGICDDELIEHARQAGYIAAFTIERRAAKRTDNPMALPRFLMTDDVRPDRLLASSENRP